MNFVPDKNMKHIIVAQLRPHSIILASCKPGRKPGRKQVESQLRTCLKGFFLRSICLARARTNESAATKKVESVSQTRTNLSKTWLQTWSKTGLQLGLLLVRIMECGL